MDKKEIEQIINDYNFACKVAERYKDWTLSSLYELFDCLGYHCYNFYEDANLFDMEIGNLTLTYCKDCGGIDKAIQIWSEDDEWICSSIKELRKELKSKKNRSILWTKKQY